MKNMKKKIILFIFFLILSIPLKVDAAFTIKYAPTPRGSDCDSNGQNCADWYDPIVDTNGNRFYCLAKGYNGPGDSGITIDLIAGKSEYNYYGTGPACAFIENNIPMDYWDFSKYGTSGNTSIMIKNDVIIKSYVHAHSHDSKGPENYCSRFEYVSGSCNSINQGAVDDGSAISASMGSFYVVGNNSVAELTISKTKSINYYVPTVSGPTGTIIATSNTGTANVAGSSVNNGKLYVIVPRSSVASNQNVSVSVSASYSTGCTFRYPVLYTYYPTSYITNGSLNDTGRKYFDEATGRSLFNESSAYQSFGYFTTSTNTFSSNFTKFASTSGTVTPSYGYLSITKRDAVTNTLLSGANYYLYSGANCGTYYGSYTTNANGQINVSNLNPGTYSYKENGAPSGYRLDSTCYNVTITANNTTGEVRTNTPIGSIIITKKDAKTHATLSGVKYALYSGANCSTVYNNNLVTDSNGKITVNNLNTGTYSYKEISTINGYKLDSTCYTIQVNKGDTTTAVRTNVPYGNIKIIKKDSVTGKVLAGVKYALYSDPGCKNVYGNNLSLFTDDNGEIIINDLDTGTYYLKEIISLSGYKIDTSCAAVVVETGKTKTVNKVNDPLGSILIKKTSDFKTTPLKDVIFKLYRDNKCTDEMTKNHRNETLDIKTNSAGTVTVTNLEAGTYYLKEYKTATDHILDTECRAVVVNKGQKTDFSLVNIKNLSITINKTDSSNNKPIAGVKFKLCSDAECTIDAKYYDGTSIPDDKLITDKDGKIYIDKLKYGVYFYKEIEAPKNYVIDENINRVVLEENVVINVKNSPIKLRIEKFSIFDKENHLPGSVIRLVYLSNITKENLDEAESFTIITEDDVISTSVIPGVYAIYEDFAPVGFVKLNEGFLIEVLKDGSIIPYTGDEYDDLLENPVEEDSEFFSFENNKLTIINEPVYVKISKQDIISSGEIEGAEIIIYDELGNEYVKFISDGKEAVKFYLEPGKYTLVEKVPPKGYLPLETKIMFTIGSYGYIDLEDGEMYKLDGDTIIIYNEMEIFDVPITGLAKNVALVLTGVLLIGGGIYVIIKFKKKEAY